MRYRDDLDRYLAWGKIMHFLKKVLSIAVFLVSFFSIVLAVKADNLTASQFEQGYHYNVPRGFMNDVQTIWKGQDGYYHLLYLYNPQYKHTGDGTVWYHVKTRDFIHYENVGISIPKFNGVWYSMATGSVIHNTNHFFKDLPSSALIAYFTSYIDGVQQQFVAYSTDEGQSFTPYKKTPIMSAKSTTSDARDPYMRYNSKTSKLNMYLAEGDKVGVYESDNGVDFKYIGATSLNQAALLGKDLGTIECPNLKQIYDPDTKELKTVLFFGANGYRYGQTTGSYYMVGHLEENGIFIAEQQPKRVDDGSDYYGANYMQVDADSIISVSWLGNWGYSAACICDEYGECNKLGSLSCAHQLTLSGTSGDYTVANKIIEPTALFSNTVSGNRKVNDVEKNEGYAQLLDLKRWSRQNIYLQFSNNDITKSVNKHIRINLKQADAWVRIDYNADNGAYMVSRASERLKDTTAKSNYEKAYVEASGVISPHDLKLHLIEDQSSLEFYFEGQNKTYSLLKYSTNSSTKINVETNGNNNLFYSLDNIE